MIFPDIIHIYFTIKKKTLPQPGYKSLHFFCFSFQHSLLSISGNMMILLNMWVVFDWPDKQCVLGLGFFFSFCLFACSLLLYFWVFFSCLFFFFCHLHKRMLLTSRFFRYGTSFSFFFLIFPWKVGVTVACLFWGLAWCQNVQNWFVFSSFWWLSLTLPHSVLFAKRGWRNKSGSELLSNSQIFLYSF